MDPAMRGLHEQQLDFLEHEGELLTDQEFERASPAARDRYRVEPIAGSSEPGRGAG